MFSTVSNVNQIVPGSTSFTAYPNTNQVVQLSKEPTSGDFLAHAKARLAEIERQLLKVGELKREAEPLRRMVDAAEVKP